jgi:hypothetical protein
VDGNQIGENNMGYCGQSTNPVKGLGHTKKELRWMEIYHAMFHRLRSEGYTEDRATELAGKHAYEECDRMAVSGGGDARKR